ncbi:conserved protein of unknown function [uncultured Sphingopyxis sp.]|uniref:Uncharacterized protein n=1 Tax=uncultured Sphingopyxis sp. TaxID=310581 RepID=A0A1Y5PY55_9SPHN|nr:conserved protein of unknown function [uncultured Sphingopyxis sp.]
MTNKETAAIGRKQTLFLTSKKGGPAAALSVCLSRRSVLMRLEVHRGELAAVVDFDVESDAVAFVEARHAGALHRADVDEGVGLSVVARDEAEALRRVEEFDGARGPLTGQLAPAARAARTVAVALARSEFLDRERLALDLEVDRRHLAVALDEREAERLARGEALEARLFDRTDVDEHVFAAIVAGDEAEALRCVEEFHRALALADDLRRHAAAASAAEAATAVAATEAAAIAAAEAAAITIAETATTAAIAVAAVGGRFEAVEIAEIIALAAPAMAAAILVETHCLVVAFGRPHPIQPAPCAGRGRSSPRARTRPMPPRAQDIA